MNPGKRIMIAAAAAVLVMGYAAAGFCGLVITEKDGGRTLVSGARIKNVPEGPAEESIIIDAKKGIVTILNPGEKTAARGTIDEFCATIKQMGGAMMEAMAQLARFEACSSQMTGPHTVEASREYQELVKQGWVLKVVSYDFGEPETILEVSRIEEKPVPSAEFEIPEGYRQVSFSRMFEME